MPRRRTRKSSREGVWYAEGLRFECTSCGACCGGAPGYVWLDRDDIRRISEFLELTETEFLRSSCRRVLTRISLKEKDNYDCVFLTDEGCGIYPVRPEQCRSFPFWADNIQDPRDWAEVARRCPGVGHGRTYTPAQIEAIRSGRKPTD